MEEQGALPVSLLEVHTQYESQTVDSFGRLDEVGPGLR